MVRSVDQDARGIVAPQVGLERFRLDRHPPSVPVARFVDRYWIVTWDLPAGERHAQQVMPHPVVNVTFESHATTVNGLTTGRVTKELSGSGRALGVMFRPGGFSPLLDAPMATLTDRTVTLASLLGTDAETAADAIQHAPDHAAMVTAADELFAAHLPVAPHPCEEAIRIAEAIAANPGAQRVEAVAAEHGIGLRSLQRLFRNHVGVSPQWVIRRYRIYEAAEQVARGESIRWADVAAELGYADQAHLTRDFTAAVGMSPTRYQRACAGEAAGRW